jgi:hypothetical protein
LGLGGDLELLHLPKSLRVYLKVKATCLPPTIFFLASISV